MNHQAKLKSDLSVLSSKELSDWRRRLKKNKNTVFLTMMAYKHRKASKLLSRFPRRYSPRRRAALTLCGAIMCGGIYLPRFFTDGTYEPNYPVLSCVSLLAYLLASDFLSLPDSIEEELKSLITHPDVPACSALKSLQFKSDSSVEDIAEKIEVAIALDWDVLTRMTDSKEEME